ncbi:copper chaperone PCu(A)C [Halomonas sp. YLGW01]|uniref:copper chaperone PCu(A)C n=1 Tax=Halomonas sp. YLGW01 TaxID=2773308 RepID=UPI00178448A5|nr:copper chaperone PCu(A)C [Halomonas sp. YLGW01]
MANTPGRTLKNCSWAVGLLMLLLCGGTAHAEDLSLEHPRLRLLPGDMPGAGYFLLHNRSEAPVTLIGARTDAFRHTELHMSMETDGMAHMHEVQSLEVAAGDSLALAPKGYHLMFMKRVDPLTVGDEVEVELLFEDRPPLPATFQVVSPIAMH